MYTQLKVTGMISANKRSTEKRSGNKFSWNILEKTHFLEVVIEELFAGDFPGGAVVKNLPANAGDTGSIPGPGRSHMLWSN